MKTEVENLNGHFKKISIELPQETVTSAITNHYKEIQKTAELKGFRKGKAPLDMIKKMYGGSGFNDVANDLIQVNLNKALVEHDMNPINMPKIDVQNFKEGEAMKFTAEFENTPPVDLKDYKSFKSELIEPEVKDEEVQAALDNMRNYFAETKDALEGTEVAKGKVVKISYKASEAGKEVEEASDKEVMLEVGNGSIPENFENQILGMKAGETKEIQVKFPEAEDKTQAAPLAGRTLDFVATIHSIHIREVPELTDDLAKKLGAESADQLKERMTADIKNQKLQTEKNKEQEKAVEFLIDKNKVDVPESMLNAQMEQLAVDAGMQLQQSGLNEAQIEEKLKEWSGEMKERAEKQVKASLVLSAISKAEKIQATEDDIRKEIMRIAQQNRQQPQDVVKTLEEKRLMGGLIRQVTELKALEWVVDQGKA